MLAYAAHRRPRRRLSPATLSLIIGGHALALALLVTARMEVTGPPDIVRTWVRNIPLPADPPPPPPEPQPLAPSPAPAPSHVTQTPPVIDLPSAGPAIDLGPPTLDIVPDISPIIDKPLGGDPPKAPVRVAARFSTPSDLVRPPYPENKRRLEEEATLRLRLTIDERGRVTAVEPVGAVDSDFLASARQHLLRHWRYKPATEDGRAVSSTLVVTLRFVLDDA